MSWLFQFLFDYVARALGFALIVAAIGWIFPLTHEYVRRALTWLFARSGRLLERTLLEKALKESKSIWTMRDPSFPAPGRDFYLQALRGEPHTLVISTLKGGVGKTTLATNLAAVWADRQSRLQRKQGQRIKSVLAVDLDFQGSMSNMILPDRGWVPKSEGEKSVGSELIDGVNRNHVPGYFEGHAIRHTSLDHLFCFPSHYDLGHTENQLQLRWTLQLDVIDSRLTDLRYRLAEVLESPPMRERFTRVVIDAPPRLTTACVQALCAASHVLVPTTLDNLAIDGVIAFLKQVDQLQALVPGLKVVGVVCTMVGDMTPEVAGGTVADRFALEHEGRAYEYLEKVLTEHNASKSDPSRHVQILPPDTFIPRLSIVSLAAGGEIAYIKAVPPEYEHEQLRLKRAFEALASQLERAMAPP